MFIFWALGGHPFKLTQAAPRVPPRKGWPGSRGNRQAAGGTRGAIHPSPPCGRLGAALSPSWRVAALSPPWRVSMYHLPQFLPWSICWPQACLRELQAALFLPHRRCLGDLSREQYIHPAISSYMYLLPSAPPSSFFIPDSSGILKLLSSSSPPPSSFYVHGCFA